MSKFLRLAAGIHCLGVLILAAVASRFEHLLSRGGLELIPRKGHDALSALS
jgi:hypothetical protein